ncbi:MAG TPA: MarR family transcriptional regulator, partial [Candidatus Pelethocola excrementipullorum]|nr:MarR family transcriptional regulator [Candidatus Pelethocola excrementipullorum]
LYHISIAGDRNLAKNLVSKGMSKANVSMSVENLKRKSLINLEEDEEDRRCLRINLTESAYPILEEVKAVKAEINNIIFQGITEEERATLEKVRVRMEKNIQKEFLETL